MEEQENLERERKKEEARRKEEADRRKKTVHAQMAAIVAAGIVIVAGLIFGLSRMNAGNASKVAEGSAIPEDEWENAEYLVSETYPEIEGERETVAAGHIWEDLPKMGVLLSICPYGEDWSTYSADNRCVLAPRGSYITGIRATLRNHPADLEGTIRYSANVSGYGWIDWRGESDEAGSAGTDTTLEAIRMQLSGELADHYDILYCVYQDGKWTDWVKNGEVAGEEGVGLHIDGVRASISRKWPGEESFAGEIYPNRPMVALTYDDGPSRTATTRILDKLESVGGRATFFMVGSQAERNPDVVKRMVEMDCEVANHTYDHIEMRNLSPQEVNAEVEAASQAIYTLCGIRPLIVRPPGGNETDEGMAVLGALAMPAILWSVDTRDWRTRDAAQTINTVLTEVKDGDIVLMHDLYDSTADASMTIIDELVARGFQLVTVSELSAYRGGLEPGKTYKHFH